MYPERSSTKKYILPLLVGIALITFLCFNYTVHNEFTNWDDDYYVSHNPYITSFSGENLKMMLTEDITKNNYHPLCMLSLAVNYHFSQLNPAPYYITNIVIHICNALLVFLLFLILGSRLKIPEQGRLVIASVGSLWFAVHPMHVESVAWIAERKDVLYCFFYVAGLITYLRYLETPAAKWYAATLFLFVLSCLSKPMAVVFPLSLICVDLLLGQSALSRKRLVQKIPFFLISLLCGGYAFYTQNKTGAVAAFGVLTLQERIMYAAYGFVMYIAKFFNPNPAGLSTFYPYPYRYISGYLPAIYYAAPFIAIAVLSIPFLIKKRVSEQLFRVVLFGIGYLFCNLVFVLQFISVGAAIMADRYSYVAYIGPMFLVPYLLYALVQWKPMLRTAVLSIVSAASLVLCLFCYQRTFAWHDAESLLSDAIQKYPYRALLSYKWLGNHYFDIGAYDKAMENYDVLVKLRATDASVERKITAIGMLQGGQGQNPAISGAMPQNDGSVGGAFQLYLDSSYYYCSVGDSLMAFRAYVHALRYNKGIERQYADSSFRAIQNQQFLSAIHQYNVLLKLSTANPFYLFYRGVGKFSTGKMMDAITDWEVAVKMDSKDVQQSASYNLSVAYDSLGKDSLAVYYLEMAKKKGYAVNQEYAEKLYRKRAKSQRR